MTCHALIEESFCPRAVAPKIDYRKLRSDDMPRRNDLLQTLPLNRSNEMPSYRGQDGCKVHGTDDQCDGQSCGSDSDCHSGCCGQFVSFSLTRCLPLTEDSLCPRFLEPSFTSPIPQHLPAIQSTIEDMYGIQDRVNDVIGKLDPTELPQHDDILSCRSYGTDLCDGFVCLVSTDCQSGCCGTFNPLKQDYCQPLLEGVCPASGFKYGFYGNAHPTLPKKAGEEEKPATKEEMTPTKLQLAPKSISDILEKEP